VLKFEQKKGTSLVKSVLSRRKSGLLQSVCPSNVIYFGYHDRISETSLIGSFFRFGCKSRGCGNKSGCNGIDYNVRNGNKTNLVETST
jgi:hypothetical protein